MYIIITADIDDIELEDDRAYEPSIKKEQIEVPEISLEIMKKQLKHILGDRKQVKSSQDSGMQPATW